MESILNSIKKLLGINIDDTSFDTDLIIHINTVFSVLTQLGVGTDKGYRIYTDSETWDDYISEDALRVKTIFDPPQSSFVLDSYKRLIDELEWRINVCVDPEK